MTTRSKVLLTASAIVMLSGTAMAADLPQQSQGTMAAATAPAASNWDGAYLGVSIGHATGKSTDDYTGPTTGSISYDMSGGLFGAQMGYNVNLSDNIILGVEGNIDGTNEKGAVVWTQNVNWAGSVRGRLGVNMGQFLPYAEAGVAFANLKYAGTVTDTQTLTGWTVGAGLEAMVAKQLSANIEYRYSDYGTKDYALNPPYTEHVHFKDSTLRVGLNYHF